MRKRNRGVGMRERHGGGRHSAETSGRRNSVNRDKKEMIEGKGRRKGSKVDTNESGESLKHNTT